MTDKNVTSGAQWIKATTTSPTTPVVSHTNTTDHKNSVMSSNLYEQTTVTQPVALYNGTIGDSAYAVSSRFHSPVLPHNISATNVSGFMPPFPPNAGVTSVLTPNPYMNTPSTNLPINANQHFQQLNQQQQIEFTKIMKVMNTAVALSTVNTTGVQSISPSNTHIHTTDVIQQPESTNLNNLEDDNKNKNILNLVGGNGNISSTITEDVLDAVSAAPCVSLQSVVPGIHGRLMGVGVAKEPNYEKLERIQHTVESSLCEQGKQKISQLIDQISTLRPVEKLLLYLRLPGESPETDPLRQPQNPLGTRSEINHTINWVRTHLEHDPQVSIPKQDVYEDYILYCERLHIKPLSTADFGKVMKQVFPGIRPRRLGTRGHSRYCYAAMRKTTKLEPPSLPQLDLKDISTINDNSIDNVDKHSNIKNDDKLLDTNSDWAIIRSWAETILKVRLENVQDLAAHIKRQSIQKKTSPLTQRELKEKRLLTDMGPLKKRRKKKRKGSSSSESSTSQQTINNETSLPLKVNNVQMEDCEQKPTSSLICNQTIKQEVIDSPVINKSHYTSTINSQNMPINLATEQRTINPQAVQNLTAKIMEISNTTIPLSASSSSSSSSTSLTTTSDVTSNIKEEIVEDYNTPTIYCKKVLKAHQTKGFLVSSLIVQQQNKNVPLTTATITPPTTIRAIKTTQSSILNLTTSSTTTTTPATNTTSISNIVVPLITKTAASPPPSVGIISNPLIDNSNTQYIMGPPAHQANNISTSPIAVLNDNCNPIKVNTQNVIGLRNKRLLNIPSAAAATTATTATTTISGSGNDEILNDDDKDNELPENLGLPRERVISICNMDKHELDDYFLPVQEEEDDDDNEEEDNSQDQDSELLQYFQTGDAEEKTNSLDAIKIRNPTATTTNNNNITTTNKNIKPIINIENILNNNNLISTTTTTNNIQTINNIEYNNYTTNINTIISTTNITITTTTTITTPTVGSASASLVYLSKKHQQQQEEQQQNINELLQNNKNSVKDILLTARKNRIFVPISPNINANSPQITSLTTVNNNNSNNTSTTLFASPVLATRLYTKQQTFLGKQQSLDSDCDPMIGANQKRRINNSLPCTSSTSAPPSPSIFHQHQQQQQQPIWLTTSKTTPTINDINIKVNHIIDQNSLDLDLFTTTTATNTNNNSNSNNVNDINLITNSKTTQELGINDMLLNSEIQRSQSVPLSHLQRMQSPLTFKSTTKDNELVKCTTTNTDKVIMSSSENNIKLDEECVLGTDSTGLLDDVDYNVMLSSPDFMSKFTGYPQNETAACSSSAGSSSGYSSGTCSAISRSVPSTPLPHHQLNIFGQKRRNNILDDAIFQNSPTFCNVKGDSAFKYSIGNLGLTNNGFSNCIRGGYDMSKSMPTTPITTPCFRYSPNELTGDFLINGHTMDNMQCFGSGLAGDCDLRAASNGLVSLGMNRSNSLLDCDVDNVGNNSVTIVDNEDFVNNSPSETEAIMIGAALLDDL